MAKFKAGGSGRPTREDRDALNILLKDPDLREWDAEFCESLSKWKGEWTVKQAAAFDAVWDRAQGDCIDNNWRDDWD